MNNSQKFTSAGIIFLFIIAIYSPLIGSIIQDDKTISYAEKRILTKFPSTPTSKEMLVEYPRKLENYYNDQFGMRELFILAFSKIKTLIGDTEISTSANKVPAGNTVKGKEGWYFLNRVWDGDPISDYRNISLYTEVDLLRATLIFAARNDWLKRQGIRYLLFFAPNKHTIYPEFMPDYIVKQGNISSMDQLYDSLAHSTSIEFVDLRETLRRDKKNAHLYWKDRKDEAALYYKTDSHWNGAGANFAQYEIAKRIEQMFPGLIIPEKRPRDDFVMFSTTGDIGLIMGRNDLDAYGPTLYTGKCAKATDKEYGQRQQVTTCATGKLNVLIFHDSFYTIPLKVFFAYYFAKTTFLWRPMTQRDVLEQLKEGKIDLVIEQRAERFLPYSPPITSELYNDFWAEQAEHWKKVIFSMDTQEVAGTAGQYAGHNVRLEYNSENKSLDMHANTDDPGLVIDQIPFAKNRLYMLYVEIESQKNTQLQLFYSTIDPAVPIPDQKNMETYTINKGQNTLYIPLFSGNLGGTLKLDPGSETGLYRLKKFEIKEVDPSSLKKT